MNKREFIEKTKNYDSDIEGILSLDNSDLLKAAARTRNKSIYVRSKKRRIRIIFNLIRKYIKDDAEISLSEGENQIIVKTDAGNWKRIVEAMTKIEKEKKITSKLYINDKVKLIR